MPNKSTRRIMTEHCLDFYGWDIRPGKRSVRRHHKDRMKAKAMRLYPWAPPGKLADNLTPCSCWMCAYGKDVPPRRERAALAA